MLTHLAHGTFLSTISLLDGSLPSLDNTMSTYKLLVRVACMVDVSIVSLKGDC